MTRSLQSILIATLGFALGAGQALAQDKMDTSKNLVVTGGWGWFGSAEARSVA